MAENVLSWSDRGRDSGDPTVVVPDHVIGGPVAGLSDPFVHTGLVDLGPLQAGLVD